MYTIAVFERSISVLPKCTSIIERLLRPSEQVETAMAYCPKCKGEMLPTAITCPHCAYDFPADKQNGQYSSANGGFAYSTFADIALIVSTFAASIGACITAIACIVSIFQGQFANGLVVYPIAFLMQVGMLVVFLRVQQ